jgi:hypothetical protein
LEVLANAVATSCARVIFRAGGMITGYLDIIRLKSAPPLRKPPVKVEGILLRLVLLVGPVAARWSIQPTLMLDAPLAALAAVSPCGPTVPVSAELPLFIRRL